MSGRLGDALERFTSGLEIAVEVGAIERELAALWRQAGARGEAVVRACLWNLVVRADGEATFARAKALVDEVAPACPARVLVLRADAPGQGAELEASIEANFERAPRGPGAGRLGSEEITIRARGRGAEHFAALVRALTVPDLPLALLWAGAPPAQAAEVRPLLAGCDRLVVDTGALESEIDRLSLSQLVALAGEVPLADLGWLRLGGIRVLLASFFDPPIGPEPLRRAVRVSLDCARHGAATALLMLGWLSCRLGWGRPERVLGEGGGARAWRVSRAGGAVRLEVGVRDVEAGRDGIYCLAIESEDGRRFAITDAGPSALRLEGAGLPDRVLAAPDRSDAELLVGALGARGQDPLLGHALACAAELCL